MIFTAFSCKNTTGQSGLAPVLGVDNHPLTDEEGVRNEANNQDEVEGFLAVDQQNDAQARTYCGHGIVIVDKTRGLQGWRWLRAV